MINKIVYRKVDCLLGLGASITITRDNENFETLIDKFRQFPAFATSYTYVQLYDGDNLVEEFTSQYYLDEAEYLREVEQKNIDVKYLFNEDITIADLVNETTSLKKNEIANFRYSSLGANDMKKELSTDCKLATHIYNIGNTLNNKCITPTRLSITFDNKINTEYYIEIEITGIENELGKLLLQIKGELIKVEWRNINNISIQDRESIIKDKRFFFCNEMYQCPDWIDQLLKDIDYKLSKPICEDFIIDEPKEEQDKQS